MEKRKIELVKEQLFWSYANLAMAHSAVEKNQTKYARFNFMIRAKLFKGLMSGNMNMRTIFDDEKIKLQTGKICNYCGSAENLSIDHIFPRKLGGTDSAENLIFACRTCNSSKGKKDLMEWMISQKTFLPLMIIRRYLKLTYYHCYKNNLLDKNIDEVKLMKLPFRIDLLPSSFPNPCDLILISKNPDSSFSEI
ncbi:MAG: hypothetical protein APR54_09920 [Candidatus Cloacimonas sp. SDB]|nr:MAG: hypothetical protein APR54_09920 [Candidatus Cloacimonas sp. SDB]